MDELIQKVESELAVQAVSQLEDIRVLFAEDSDQTVNIFKEVTHSLGWRGLFVSNAVEMINAVNNLLTDNLDLDAVVADISFLSGPQLTGLTAAREIRKAMPNVPVIFISAYVTSIIREEVRRVGAEIIKKPFDVESLFVRLSQLVYWNRLVTAKAYEGEDRRRNSVNRTDNSRRATDYILSTPERIAKTLKQLKREP